MDPSNFADKMVNVLFLVSMRNLFCFLFGFFFVFLFEKETFIFLFINNFYISLGDFRAFQGLCINEFSGLKFDHQQPFDIQTGEQVKGRVVLLFYFIM